MSKEFISIGGFASTGGTAIRDFLKQNSQIEILTPEFRLLVEYGGCLDLIRSIESHKLLEEQDLAFRHFEFVAKCMGKSSKHWYLHTAGLDYKKYFKDYSSKTQSYLDRITSHRYLGDWYYFDWIYGFYSQVLRRIGSKLGAAVELESRVSFLELSELIHETNKFVQELFVDWDNTKIIGLQNAVPLLNFSDACRSIEILGNPRVIIVDRNPRDIFLDMYKGRYIGQTHTPKERARQFVRVYKRMRRDKNKILNLDNVHEINFNEFLETPHLVIERLQKFLGIEIGSNLHGPYFNISKSRSIQPVTGGCQELETILSYIDESCK